MPWPSLPPPSPPSPAPASFEQAERLAQRLQAVCAAEGLSCEKSTLRLLVERTECDIRSCLNTLQARRAGVVVACVCVGRGGEGGEGKGGTSITVRGEECGHLVAGGASPFPGHSRHVRLAGWRIPTAALPPLRAGDCCYGSHGLSFRTPPPAPSRGASFHPPSPCPPPVPGQEAVDGAGGGPVGAAGGAEGHDQGRLCGVGRAAAEEGAPPSCGRQPSTAPGNRQPGHTDHSSAAGRARGAASRGCGLSLPSPQGSPALSPVCRRRRALWGALRRGRLSAWRASTTCWQTLGRGSWCWGESLVLRWCLYRAAALAVLAGWLRWAPALPKVCQLAKHAAPPSLTGDVCTLSPHTAAACTRMCWACATLTWPCSAPRVGSLSGGGSQGRGGRD
jgi:hypothetical protein